MHLKGFQHNKIEHAVDPELLSMFDDAWMSIIYDQRHVVPRLNLIPKLENNGQNLNDGFREGSEELA